MYPNYIFCQTTDSIILYSGPSSCRKLKESEKFRPCQPAQADMADTFRKCIKSPFNGVRFKYTYISSTTAGCFFMPDLSLLPRTRKKIAPERFHVLLYRHRTISTANEMANWSIEKFLSSHRNKQKKMLMMLIVNKVM